MLALSNISGDINNPVLDIVVTLTVGLCSWIFVSLFIVVSFYPITGAAFLLHFRSANHPSLGFVKLKNFSPCLLYHSRPENYHTFQPVGFESSDSLVSILSIVDP